jgi:hypothetical protein
LSTEVSPTATPQPFDIGNRRRIFSCSDLATNLAVGARRGSNRYMALVNPS